MNKLRAFLFYGLIIALAAGAGPAISGVWQWSKTADSNAGSDPSINWAEGMSPSSVNDSARAMMSAIANYRDDISGLLTTGGTSTAYTVTTNSVLCQAPASTTTPLDGQLLSITVNSTNGTSPTLTADSCNAFPIQSSAGVAVASATLVSGSPYNVRFSTANSAWMLKGFYSNPAVIPLGMAFASTLTTVPNSNFAILAGQCLSTITYATYWNALGSPGPGSCSANQFRLVDMSGSIPAGLDTMPGFSAANRLTNSSTGCGTAMTSVGARCANGAQSYTMQTANLPPYAPAGNVASNISNNGIFGFTFGGNTVGVGGTATGGTAVALNGNQLIGSSFTGTAQGGTSTPFPIVGPYVGFVYMVRVL